MSRKMVSSMLILSDIIIVAVVPIFAFLIRFDGSIGQEYFDQLMTYLPIIILIRIATFYLFRLYNRLWRYASINELVAVVSAVTVSSVVLTAYIQFIQTGFPRSIHVLCWILNILFIGASRITVRLVYQYRAKAGCDKVECRVLIVGAGDAGAMLAREMLSRPDDGRILVGFVDDDGYKQNLMLYGVKVLGMRHDIKVIVEQQDIHEIVIAMPSVEGSIVRQIVHECKNTQCTIKILPGLYDLIDGKVSLQQLRNVDVEDLLRRDSVKLDIDQIATCLKNKRVLVTGAGGSIGSELCRQVAKLEPAELVLLGRGENSIYEIDYELRQSYHELKIVPVIADVRDQNRIHHVFDRFRPQVVFHAAAHKHVPLMEAQPDEAVKNNIFGTKNVAEAANQFAVENFVMISTDKAVNPTSVMGATKRVAELVIQNISKSSKTKFCAVRFGNVLGSRGSVIPLFKKQIAKGGPITITHPDMKRYFMTIPEAAQLVLQAGAQANGGELFVLDMGEPVRILDMACDLIELSGLKPYEDIEIKFCGLRPGEKLFEELLTAEEGTKATKHQKIYVANIKEVNSKQLMHILALLQNQSCNEQDIITLFMQCIPTYTPDIGVKRNVNSSEESKEDMIKAEYFSPVVG